MSSMLFSEGIEDPLLVLSSLVLDLLSSFFSPFLVELAWAVASLSRRLSAPMVLRSDRMVSAVVFWESISTCKLRERGVRDAG